MKKNYFLILSCLLFTNSMLSQIAFVESSSAYGVNASYGTGFVGGGISFCDFDGDGWDDITLATESGEPARFFKNNSGVFLEVFPNMTDFNNDYKQVIWIDYDNDGDKDLYLASHNAASRLYRNEGNLNFTDVTISSGIFNSNQKSFGAAWGDYDNDGFLDVFLTYRSTVESNRLYRNNGDGTFTDISTIAGISSAGHLSFCASFFDYNNDGFQDIYIANDRHTTTNILYENNGDGTFTDASASSGSGLIVDAMSTTIGDYNNDGWFDIYITNTLYVYEGVDHEIGNVFLRNNGDGTFSNIAADNGTDFNSVAWGAVFLDADNDMDLDLYVSGMLDGSMSLPSAFYENDGMSHYSIPANAGFLNDTRESYSNAIGDINNNGYPDIIVNNEAANMFLWENNCDTNINNNWLKVELEGSISNKDGIGSKIEISINGNKQYRYTVAGEGYISQNSNSEFFGLADNSVVDYIKVNWLSGIEDVYTNINANQTISLVEGETLSIASFSDTSKPKIFPIPFSDILSIKNSKPIKEIKLVNTIGQVVYYKGFSTNNFAIDIDVSNLYLGSYIIMVTTSEQVYFQKLIKQ